MSDLVNINKPVVDLSDVNLPKINEDIKRFFRDVQNKGYDLSLINSLLHLWSFKYDKNIALVVESEYNCDLGRVFEIIE